MSLATPLVNRLASILRQQLKAAALGHCIRVDHLDADDASAVCQQIREDADGGDICAFLLSAGENEDPLAISPQEAIEIRNRKQVKLCLLIPVGMVDATASSLTNSFASFDLQGFWGESSRELLGSLPDEIHAAVRRVLSTLRGVMAPSMEKRADYLAAVTATPSFETVGIELWRVGLIPDLGGEALIDRLEKNQACARELVRPARAQSSAAERLAATKFRDGSVKNELLSFFSERRLRDAQEWLRELSSEHHRGRITFEKWSFEEGEQSDLEQIEIESLLDENGCVRSYTKLAQTEVGTQPLAAVGPKEKMAVKWIAQPKSPANLKRWKAELIPSRDFYAEHETPGIELPQARAGARSRQVSIPLDIDMEDEPSVAVQVRLVALDEHENEMTNAEGRVVEGISDEFWVTEERQVEPEDSGRGRTRTVDTLPLGRLNACLELDAGELEEGPSQWTERDIDYFSVSLNGRHTIRLGVSPILRRVQTLAIDDSANCGCFRARSEGNELLNVDALEAVPLTMLSGDEEGQRFLKQRKSFLKKIASQEHRGLVETCNWDDDLLKAAKRYASAYLAVLNSSKPDVRSEALRVDTFQLEIEFGGAIDSCLLTSPTHPLRILWYATYSDLLRNWEVELLQEDRKKRATRLDIDLLAQISPLNCPAFSLTDSGKVYLFTQNLCFFWGISLPIEVRDPARRVANIARTVGLTDDEASVADLPPHKVVQELNAYHGVHPYLETLRLSLVNPGAGGFAAQVLRQFYHGLMAASFDEDERDEQELMPPPRLELFAHTHRPLPPSLAPLAELQTQLYEVRPPGHHHHLAPFFSMAIRPEEDVVRIPGGDVNLSLVMDELQPQILPTLTDEGNDSASFNGLLLRMVPTFSAENGGVRWEHRFHFPKSGSGTRRSTHGAFTKDLIELHQGYQAAIACELGGDADNSSLAVVVDMPKEQRERIDAIHQLSDWVVTLDRYLGVEYYDAPIDMNLSDVAEKYLLDYAPEFLEGLGHRLLVTTTHREEVQEILSRAMIELGFDRVEDSVGRVLHHLKTISGRLALRILGDQGRAREAVSLGIVAAYLQAKGEFDDTIVVPVDAHPELFGPMRPRRGRQKASRCDILLIRFLQSRLVVTFVEVKSRSAAGQPDELLNRIVDQIEATEKVVEELFFSKDPVRLDHVLQRSRLATILRFYLRRAIRYGLITSQESRDKIEQAIDRLETQIPNLRVERKGFVVNLQGMPQRPTRLRDTEIRFITARDVAEANLSKSTSFKPPNQSDSTDVTSDAGAGSELGTEGDGGELKVDDDAEDSSKRSHMSDDRDLDGRQDEESDVVKIELGATLVDQDPVVWESSVRGSPHLFVIGIPGQGKSWTTTRILCDLAKQHVPALVVDFHGQFADPECPYTKSANPTVVDVSNGLPFSPFEADPEQRAGTGSWQSNCFALAEIFEYVCGLGDIQRDVVFQALRDCYVDVGFDSGTPERLPTLDEFCKRLEEVEESRGVRNVVPRCRPLLEFGLFPSTTETTELNELLQRGMVVDVHELGMETLQMAAGAFVLRKIYKDMFRWGEADRLRLAIVLDEAHRLARDVTLPKIMKEGRKFGVAVIVASQGLADFHPDVVGNAGTKVVFRTNYPMSKKVAGFLRTRKSKDLAETIEQLEVGEALVQTPEMTQCAHVRMHPLHED